MERLYKYYCRVCKEVTDWQITNSSDGLEEHKCLVCGDTEMFRADPSRALKWDYLNVPRN